MAEDDKEKDANEDLPPKVKRALAEAKRKTAPKAAGSNDGRWLALIPVLAAALLLPLMMPRATVPHDIPLPYLDGNALRATIRADRSRAAIARDQGHRLPSDVLAVGTAIRAFNVAQSKLVPGLDTIDEKLNAARMDLDAAVRSAVARPGATEDLLALRAVQTEEFVEQVAAFESSGHEPDELVEVAGGFVRHMREAGWTDGNRVILDDAQRRVAYKVVWNAVVAVDRVAPFALTVDEERALYTLYIEHPHPPDMQRLANESERALATTPDACRRVNANFQRAAEGWRIDKIRAFGAKDPSYPTAYALGVAFFRAGRYEASMEAFRAYLDKHPDGAFSLRARNHLKAAVEANGAI